MTVEWALLNASIERGDLKSHRYIYIRTQSWDLQYKCPSQIFENNCSKKLNASSYFRSRWIKQCSNDSWHFKNIFGLNDHSNKSSKLDDTRCSLPINRCLSIEAFSVLIESQNQRINILNNLINRFYFIFPLSLSMWSMEIYSIRMCVWNVCSNSFLKTKKQTKMHCGFWYMEQKFILNIQPNGEIHNHL